MAKSYPTIAATAIDAESPVTEDLVGDFEGRDESLISYPLDIRFPAVTGITDAGYTQHKTRDNWYGPPVGSGGSIVLANIVLEVRVVGTATGQVRVRLGSGGTFVEGATFTSTTFIFQTFAIPTADVEGAANTVETLEIEVRRTAGAGTIEIRCENGASRVEAT